MDDITHALWLAHLAALGARPRSAVSPTLAAAVRSLWSRLAAEVWGLYAPSAGASEGGDAYEMMWEMPEVGMVDVEIRGESWGWLVLTPSPWTGGGWEDGDDLPLDAPIPPALADALRRIVAEQTP